MCHFLPVHHLKMAFLAGSKAKILQLDKIFLELFHILLLHPVYQSIYLSIYVCVCVWRFIFIKIESSWVLFDIAYFSKLFEIGMTISSVVSLLTTISSILNFLGDFLLKYLRELKDFFFQFTYFQLPNSVHFILRALTFIKVFFPSGRPSRKGVALNGHLTLFQVPISSPNDFKNIRTHPVKECANSMYIHSICINDHTKYDLIQWWLMNN